MACVLASTGGVVFGFADGMRRVAFRLDPVLAERALATGAAELPEVGTGWAAFELFRDGWPAVDLPFRARRAHVFARS